MGTPRLSHLRSTYYRGLHVSTQLIIPPSKFAICYVHIRHDPLVSHVEIALWHM